MKKGLWLSVVLLTACSSPPEAPKVDWGKKEVAVNAKIMTWTPIHTVVSSIFIYCFYVCFSVLADVTKISYQYLTKEIKRF
ncbi:hypothetical protein [Proteus mirabilis]|uniref:hypothetical protein n=1 Tax=Proteus mirabilis TaxID=584 RepID=UPI0013D16BB4|nr:hypothetical protein [Proteus mirabilis]